MQFVSAVSDRANTAEALEQVIDAARRLKQIDFAALYITGAHAGEAEWISERINSELEPATLIGCTGEGVIGGDREIERAPGISLLAGSIPGARVGPVLIEPNEWEDLLGEQVSLIERLGHGEESRALIGMGDPWTCPIDALMKNLDDLKLPLIGGMASAARQPGENRLFFNDRVLDSGFVGVTLNGAIQVDSIVSQGCKPIGQRFVVTRAKENVIEALGGKRAIDQLRDVIEAMPDADKQLLRYGLYIGRAISEYRDTFGRGDFLIRNVMQLDQETGALALGDYVRVGQTVQFHVRDAQTAEEDYRFLMENAAKPQAAKHTARAALMFSCNGRGTRMFAQSCHDIAVAHEILGEQLPIAGFFAAGELGPVGGQNFMHGHTASLAIIRSS